MKKIKLIALISLWSLLSSQTIAQDETQAKTLLDQKDLFKNIGFIVSPSYSLTTMDAASVSLLTINGGIVLDKKVTIGGFYTFSLNEIKPKSEVLPSVYMDYQAGGGYLEYTLYSDKLVHVTFPLFAGGGEVEMDNESGNTGLGEATFFLLEPSALLEINLHKHVRLNIGASYRYIGQMSYRNLDQSDISGFSGRVGLKFGLF